MGDVPQRNRRSWTFDNKDVRLEKNVTMGIRIDNGGSTP